MLWATESLLGHIKMINNNKVNVQLFRRSGDSVENCRLWVCGDGENNALTTWSQRGLLIDQTWLAPYLHLSSHKEPQLDRTLLLEEGGGWDAGQRTRQARRDLGESWGPGGVLWENLWSTGEVSESFTKTATVGPIFKKGPSPQNAPPQINVCTWQGLQTGCL